MTLRSVAFALLATAALSGCALFGDDLKRSERPIPPKLLSEMNAKGLGAASPILIRVFKQESELELWKMDRTGRYALLKTYPICRWSGKLGPKTTEGDRQTPEGFYSIAQRQMNPDSRYYLSFNLGFPNRLEAALGYEGSALMIHGACSSRGCYAVTDNAAFEIYALAREAFRGGQPAFQVEALPFRMTPANLALHRNDPNMPFWRNLKEGSDAFELTRKAPRVGYCGGRYVFNADNVDGSVDPLAPCPPLQVDAELSAAVAAKAARDDAAAAAIAAANPAMPAMSYVDGGMHPAFRAILQDKGAKKLSKMTSEKTPVSQPDAALADPYTPDLPARLTVGAGGPSS
ncbi:L,D-transpeptidase family protein [Pleomorphomonas sp. NRK KF1]|uniref:L,D-transpeptidase family protein n=1 Tax=Pleomorphomonas sp. NRK KF1 TaxID=2943000 RepID=UPI00204343BC|nr:murein L,D-transpeptidase [Pleomorphomonas sp. NRK KF1]